MEISQDTQKTLDAQLNLSGRLTTTWMRFLPIILVLLVGAGMRLYQISQPFTDVLSWRQASAAMMADNFYHHGFNIFFPRINWFGPEPTFDARQLPVVSYLAALLYLVFGQADWVGRLVGVFFGVWGIFALYRLVRRAWDEAHAITSAAVLALLPGAVYLDRSFLPEPAMVALSITSLWMFVTYYQTDKSRYLLLAIVFGALSIMTGLSGLAILVPVVYAAYALLERETLITSRKPVILTIAVLAMLSAVLWYADWAHKLALAYSPREFGGYGIWLWNDGLDRWWSKGFFLPTTLSELYRWVWTGPIAALFVLGLLFSPRATMVDSSDIEVFSTDEQPTRAPWLFHWWLLGAILFYGVSARNFKDAPWMFHMFSPIVAGVAGHGLILIWSLKGVRWNTRSAALRTVVTLLLIVIAGGAALPAMYEPDYANHNYKMGLALRDITQLGDLIVTVPSDPRDPIALYYSQRSGWVFPPADINLSWNKLPVDEQSIGWLEHLREQGAGWVAIASDRDDFWIDRPNLRAYLKKTAEFKVKTDDYIIYRLLSPAELAAAAKK